MALLRCVVCFCTNASAGVVHIWQFVIRHADSLLVQAKSLAKLREAVIFAVHSLAKSSSAFVQVEALCDGVDFRAPISLGR